MPIDGQLPYDIPGDTLLRPLVQTWTVRLESAAQSRSRWQGLVDEIMLFYGRSAAAMWDTSIAKKFWTGNITPRFRVSVNLAYEYVAVMLPNLLWENPHRNVQPKASIEVPQEMFGEDEESQMMLMQIQREQQQNIGIANLSAHMQQDWLNYTAREQPQGLLWHSTMATLDALLKGRGCLWTRPHQFPGSQRLVTGCFREAPENLFIDPDSKTLADAKWIALKHVEPHAQVESRFKLPKGYLRKRATLESSWAYAQNLLGSQPSYVHRVDGQSNDLVVWYEVFSKCGVGVERTDTFEPVKQQLNEVVGDYAYLAICPACPWPLNAPTDKIMGGASSDDVGRMFEWPVPLFWKDDRWPVECLDFYPNNDEKDPGAAWPIPPLGPALGEIKLLNYLIPFLTNRVWMSSRDFWAVLGPHLKHYQKYLESGDDQTIIPTPAMTDDVRKVVTILQQPETRRDMWELIGLVEELFRKRVGLPVGMYGQNEGGSQNRSAEETVSKNRAYQVRPDFMQKMVVNWQSNAAASEAMVARRFIRAPHVEPRMGQTMAGIWDRVVASDDDETIARQFDYTIEAASIRRPNRESDIANLQQVAGIWLPVAQQAAGGTGDYSAVNEMMRKWGEFHDQDMTGMFIPDQSEQIQQAQQQQQQMAEQEMQMEQAKMQADLQGKQMDAQGKQVDMEAKVLDAKIKQEVAQADMGRKVAETQLDMAARQQEMEFDAQMARQKLEAESGQTLMQILAERQKSQQAIQHESQMGAIKTVTAVQDAKVKMDLARVQAKEKAKLAKQKPKPQGKKK